MERFRRRSSVDPPTRLRHAVSSAFQRFSPARRAGNNTGEDLTSVEFKGPLGLTLLHTVPEPVVDFIFIHGFGGGSRKSWCFSADPKHYWPKEWLSKDPSFRYARIFTFGYRTDGGETKPGDKMETVHDVARSLLVEMDSHPDMKSNNKTRIALVAHSMGGIVAKKAYLYAKENPIWSDLAPRFHSFYFLATPHSGSDLATVLTNILKLTHGSKPFVEDLAPKSELIASINDSFRYRATDLHLWSFYETVPSNLVVTKVMIVHKVSATVNHPAEKISPLDADHHMVCKFDQPTDPNYVRVRNALIHTIDTVLSKASEIKAQDERNERQKLVDLLGVSEPPVNELYALENIRVKGSCEWLMSRKLYQSWRTEHPANCPILLLTGNPGSGKSVLSSQVINDLQKHEQTPSYFFFKHGVTTRSTVTACLRSLAYQMATSDKMILRRMLDIETNTTNSWLQWDQTIWRKLFVGCIFKELNSLPIFWVVDGLDECDDLSSFIAFLAQTPSHVKIMLTSRKTPAIDNSLDKIRHLISQHQMDDSDTVSDIGIFIDSKMDNLPAEGDGGRERLRSKILENACGSFLWASLVVKELEHVYSEEGAEEVLNEVPRDMNKLYAQMLQRTANNQRTAILASSIFMWVLLAYRPLNTDEIISAIKLDTHHTVHNLEKSIPAICGQLASVNQRGEVAIIHQTAKAYLLQQEDFPGLSVDRAKSHDRIALLCLNILSDDGINRSSAWISKSSLADYACKYFSYHLRNSSSGNLETWNLLFKFLETNVLVWIEYLATEDIRPIVRTAKDLQIYSRQCAKRLPQDRNQKNALGSWINDLTRLSTAFGAHLRISPSSAHSLITEMCPRESAISKTYIPRHHGLVMRGLVRIHWDDCLARIDYANHHVTTMAQGDGYSAVATSEGTIFLYHSDSIQSVSTLSHGDWVELLAISAQDRYLASISEGNIKIWDMTEGSLVRVIPTKHSVSTLFFSEDLQTITVATENNETATWCVQSEDETDRWEWVDSIDNGTDGRHPGGQPQVVALSPDCTFLAASYRGFPVFLFKMETKRFIGRCNRFLVGPDGAFARECDINAIAFNPSPCINMIVVSYQDGELALYDPVSTELRRRIPKIFAYCLAYSSDGRRLVTSTAQGKIQIFEFAGAKGDSLSLLYRIEGFQGAIREVAFSIDGLRFADITNSFYRLWAPAVLACNEYDDDSQSGISQAASMDAKSVTVSEQRPEMVIEAMCCHASGELVFCGERNGSLSYLDTHLAVKKDTLFTHRSVIHCIAFFEAKGLLITGSLNGEVRVSHVVVNQKDCKVTALLAKFRVEVAPSFLLLDASHTKILIAGAIYAGVWTTDGRQIGPQIDLPKYDGKVTFANHPLWAEYFVSIRLGAIEIFSWETGLEAVQTPIPGLGSLNMNAPLCPETNDTCPVDGVSEQVTRSNSPRFIVDLFKSTYGSLYNTLKVWHASNAFVSELCLEPILVPALINHSNKIHQIITVSGSVMLFIDIKFWMCSFDLEKARTTTTADGCAKRHFFLLPDWQKSWKKFLIEYIPVKREFIVATRQGLVVIDKGFEFEDEWPGTMLA